MTTLADSGELSPLGLGAWAMGGPGWQGSWGPQDDEQSQSTIARALAVGITWVDTAPVYGLGHSEEVLGRAIAGRRDEVFIATKCINRWDQERRLYQSGAAASVREECEQSLRRLGIEHVDLLQIHGPTDDVPVEETWGTLVELKREGKARWIGVSNFNVARTSLCMAVGQVDSTQPPYNLLNRQIEADLLPYCQENRIAVVPYGPLAQGMLTTAFDPQRLQGDDWRRNDAARPQVEKASAIRDRLLPLARSYGVTTGHLAIAWAMAHPAVTSPIVGARRPDQVDSNMVAIDLAREPGLREAVEAVLVVDRFADGAAS